MPAAGSTQMDKSARTARPVGPLTLAIDVGGTHLKAGILAPTGTMTAGPVRVDTPHPATPAAVVDALVDLVGSLRPFDLITKIDGHEIDNTGMVKINDGLRLRFQYLIQKVAKAGKVPLSIVRQGKTMQCHKTPAIPGAARPAE